MWTPISDGKSRRMFAPAADDPAKDSGKNANFSKLHKTVDLSNKSTSNLKGHLSIFMKIYNFCLLQACLPLAIAGVSQQAAGEEFLFTLSASPDHGELGSGFSAAGDVNGDGVVDVAVADRSGRVAGWFGSGMVYLVSGTDGSVIRSYVGTPAEAQGFGSSLVGLNADGDSIPDLAIGAPGQGDASGFGAGSVSIYSGASGALLTTTIGPSGALLGVALVNAGDQDGDGRDDLYAGAPGTDTVLVISGKTGAVLRTLSAGSSSNSFGVTMARVGDVDQDGRADLAVGEPGFFGDGFQAGRVVLVRSSDGTVAAEAGGSGFFNRFAHSMAPSADANGDGFSDVMVGSYSGGVAKVLSGTDLSTLVDLSLPELPIFRPLTVGGSLDIDLDGTADWLIGSPALQLKNEEPVGGIRVVSGLDRSALFEFTAEHPESGLGLSLQVMRGVGMAAGETSAGLAHVWKVEERMDLDGDGVNDDVDQIPESIMDPTVVILGVDSGVINSVDAQGVTLADRFAELGALSDYKNSAQFFVKAKQFAKCLEVSGRINPEESKKISKAAQRVHLEATRKKS